MVRRSAPLLDVRPYSAKSSCLHSPVHFLRTPIPSLTSLIVSDTTVLYAAVASCAPPPTTAAATLLSVYCPTHPLAASRAPCASDDDRFWYVPYAISAHPTMGTLLPAYRPTAPNRLPYLATAASPPTSAVVLAAPP